MLEFILGFVTMEIIFAHPFIFWLLFWLCILVMICVVISAPFNAYEATQARRMAERRRAEAAAEYANLLLVCAEQVEAQRLAAASRAVRLG